jgi:hypothetical protein
MKSDTLRTKALRALLVLAGLFVVISAQPNASAQAQGEKVFGTKTEIPFALKGDIYFLEVKGYGKSSPKVANTTDANRARNRRVEIKVIPATTEKTGGL